MKKLFIILLAFCALFIFILNANFIYKKQRVNNALGEISQKGSQIKDFVPKNWEILRQASGDLNNDGHEDVALVTQPTDQNLVGTNQRTLMILFQDPRNQSYDLIIKNNSFILNKENPEMDEPFVGMAIQEGDLVLHFKYWVSAGSWYMSDNTYIFSYLDNDFVLIGAETREIHRASGESLELSVDFLAKKYKKTTGNAFDEKVKSEVEWKEFELDNLKTLETFVTPWIWEFDDGVIL